MNLLVNLARFSEIETARCWMRPVKISDSADMYEYSRDPENLTFIYPPFFSLADTEIILVENFMRKPLGHWAIVLKSNEKMIGTISLSHLSTKNRTAEVGYVLNKAFWGQGLMTEVLTDLSNFFFAEFGLKKVEILVDQANQASIKVAQKAGFQFVERFKAHNQYSSKIRDFERYQMTPQIFDSFVKNKSREKNEKSEDKH